MDFETLASQVTSLVAVIVYGTVAVICFHTAFKREQISAILFFNRLVGFFCFGVAGVYLFSLVGILSDPLPPLIGRNIVVGGGFLLGFAAFAFRAFLTRPKN